MKGRLAYLAIALCFAPRAFAACNPDDMQGRWRLYFDTVGNQAYKCALLLQRNPARDFVSGGRQEYVLEVVPQATNCSSSDGSAAYVLDGDFGINTGCVWGGDFFTVNDLYHIPNAVMSQDGLTVHGRITNFAVGTNSAFSGAKGE